MTEELKGKQVGLINYADSDKVRQYGLLCVRPGKKWRWNVEIDIGRYVSKR